MTGKIHSFQSLGTVDGPGVRFVVFMHGCNLRCGYCQNIDVVKGEYEEYSPSDVLDRVLRFKEYFGTDGGITVSGGEPLIQAEFVCELFKLCKENGISTALDTSGSILNDSVLKLLDYTDIVLLDIKMCNDNDYQKHIGCSIDLPLQFLKEINRRNIDCWMRHVVIEGVNDSTQSILKLKDILKDYSCIKKTELLPFKKLCIEKYKKMGIEFPFEKYPETSSVTIDKLRRLI